MSKAAYIGVNGVARKIKKGYIGITEIMFEGVAERWGDNEFYFGVGGASLTAGSGYNVKINGVTYTGFTASFWAEEGWHISNGDILVKVEGAIQGQNGAVYIYDTNGRFAEDVLEMRIFKGNENTARKIKKAYIGIGGVARPCWSGGELAYYGSITSLSQSRDTWPAKNKNYAVFGGGQSSLTDVTNVVDAYNSQLVKFTPEVLSQARTAIATGTAGGYAVFAGGRNTNGSSSGYSTVDAYSENLTRITTSLSATKHGSAGATFGNYAVIAGGYNGSMIKVVEYFNENLTRSTATALSVARNGPQGQSNGDYLIIGGGVNNSGTALTTVDAYNASFTRNTPTVLSKGRISPSSEIAGDYVLFAGGASSNWAGAYSTVDAYNKSLTRSIPTELSRSCSYFAHAQLDKYALFNAVDVNAYDNFLVRTVFEPFNDNAAGVCGTSIGNYALFVGGTANVANAYTID